MTTVAGEQDLEHGQTDDPEVAGRWMADQAKRENENLKFRKGVESNDPGYWESSAKKRVEAGMVAVRVVSREGHLSEFWKEVRARQGEGSDEADQASS